MKQKSLKSLKAKLWKLISIHIRSVNADFAGYVACYTCNKVRQWKQMDCGHFIHNKLDFDERNLKVQCKQCNKYKRGNLQIYLQNLIETYGLEWVKQLREDAKKGNNYSRLEIMELLKKYE
jgi:hypothetical protein